MAPLSTKVGHGLAKVLGIQLNYREYGSTNPADAKLTRGESVFSVDSADTYVEEEPTSWEWIAEHAPTKHDVVNYFRQLFPFINWIHRYNLQWLIGDLVAGITIGAVVVPQGMAYAGLAKLPVEFGLYSAFMGTLIYWFFATSKDITIGPVAVMSTIVGDVVIQTGKHSVYFRNHPWVIAEAMAILAGAFVCALGLLRIGWIVDLISLTSVTAFITGSAFYIAIGQIPGLLGIPSTKVDNRAATYKVVIGIFTHLNACTLDAAIGLTGLLLLYIIKYTFVYLSKRFPKQKKLFFFLNTLRTIFVILLYTLISWLVNMHHRQHPRFKILGTVPRGFTRAGVPEVNLTVIKTFAPKLPAIIIVMIIEHISIAKSFGRINNYTINPSQEFVAIGVTNLLAPFLGAYPATGSFSRTAIKSKAGVRTPLAGVFSSIIVLIAIYALTAVFFYIPSAILSAVIIHAVLDLIAPANTVYQFWRISPLEVLIFFAGVIVTVFSSIENGVYVTVSVSAALFGFRVMRTPGRLLGRVKIHSVVGDYAYDDKKGEEKSPDVKARELAARKRRDEEDTTLSREIFLPLDHQDGSNPDIAVERSYPGIFIFRFSEGFTFLNAGEYLDNLVQAIFKETRRTNPNTYAKPGDRPWNDPGPKKGKEQDIDYSKPTLKAVILDFSSVNNIDITSIQTLIDIRNQLDRHAAPEVVEWHFAYINNRWTKRGLASAGFGYPTPTSETGEYRRWKPVYSVSEIGGEQSAAAAAEARENKRSHSRAADIEAADLDKQLSHSQAYHGSQTPRIATVQGLNRPFFHIDITSALHSAIQSARAKEGFVEEVPVAAGSSDEESSQKGKYV